MRGGDIAIMEAHLIHPPAGVAHTDARLEDQLQVGIRREMTQVKDRCSPASALSSEARIEGVAIDRVESLPDAIHLCLEPACIAERAALGAVPVLQHEHRHRRRVQIDGREDEGVVGIVEIVAVDIGRPAMKRR